MRLLYNSLYITLRHSFLRFVIIVFSSALVWGGVFAVSMEGFSFLHRNNIPLAGGIVGTLFDIMFMTLAVLLIFSTGIILYSSLFSSAESFFLLSTPARADKVFAYKYQAAIAFSSWAFLLLASPLLVAYGLAFSVPWYYYFLIVLFFLGFVLLPGCIGAFACLLLVNYLPRRRRQVVVLAALALIAGLIFWIYQMMPANWTEVLKRDFMRRLLGQFAVVQAPLSPNHWLTRGLQSAARGEILKSLYYLALLWSNGLFLYLLVTWSATSLYPRGFNRIATGGSLRRRYGQTMLDRMISRMVSFLDPQTRLLLIKDFRMFRRDPAQWAQVLIFAALMVIYFTNMRQFYHEELGRTYQNGVSLMNLAATALLLCAYTGRFIFPMLSLEGRKFWILGLLPLPRERLLWGKFAFSATWSVLIAEFLVIFSDLMLGMPGAIIGLHALTVVVLALGLSGLSVGLGASMPNFRETDPSKIAVGFGGTLNLIAGLLFLLVVIGLMAVPWHLRLVALDRMETSLDPTGAPNPAIASVTGWLFLGVIAGAAVGVAAVYFPLRMGVRVLRRMEF